MKPHKRHAPLDFHRSSTYQKSNKDDLDGYNIISGKWGYVNFPNSGGDHLRFVIKFISPKQEFGHAYAKSSFSWDVKEAILNRSNMRFEEIPDDDEYS